MACLKDYFHSLCPIRVATLRFGKKFKQKYHSCFQVVTMKIFVMFILFRGICFKMNSMSNFCTPFTLFVMMEGHFRHLFNSQRLHSICNDGRASFAIFVGQGLITIFFQRVCVESSVQLTILHTYINVDQFVFENYTNCC